MIFYLGTHKPGWLSQTDVPMLVSRRTLAPRKSLPVALGGWALDSGGFSELALYGGWSIETLAYTEEVQRFREEIGGLQWAAPQDWMCEPQILRATGMSVQEHQRRTVANFIDLRQRWPGQDCPVIPVLQGWTIPDYLACLAMYRAEGIDLVAEPLVGLGSVCRRQATREVAGLVMRLAGMGLKLHGFGVKGGSSVRPLLESPDSMAWSYKARIEGIRLPGHPHRKCSNCLPWALQWARNLQDLGATPCQGSLL